MTVESKHFAKLCQSLGHRRSMGELLFIQATEDLVFGIMVLFDLWIVRRMNDLPKSMQFISLQGKLGVAEFEFIN